MSSIGKNIKKIRGVKGLNQSDFADLFNLKRASIGAYEEGRAEPKLSTILEIANHFGISVDDLLKKDLSVNDLYHFDIFRKDLIKGAKHNLKPTKFPQQLISIPFIAFADQQEYFLDRDKENGFSQITLPLRKGFEYRAFEIGDNAMLEQGIGFGAGDIVIAFKPPHFQTRHLEMGKIYLFEKEDALLFRRLSKVGKESLSLEAFNVNFYREDLPIASIVDQWQVERVITKNISEPSALKEQIESLRREILDRGQL